MSAVYHLDAMARRLPVSLQEGPVLRALLAAISGELERIDAANRRLLRSRYVRHADAWNQHELDTVREIEPADPDAAEVALKSARELGRISALIGVTPEPGELPKELRRRMSGLMAVHRVGLGTAEAVLRLAAMVYRTETEPVIKLERNSGTLLTSATFGIVDHALQERQVTLVVEDNPVAGVLLKGKLGVGGTFSFPQASLDAIDVTLELRPVDGALTCPTLRHVESGRYLLVPVTVPKGSTLTLRPGARPRLDGRGLDSPPLAWGPGESLEVAMPDPTCATFTLPHGTATLALSSEKAGTVFAALVAQPYPGTNDESRFDMAGAVFATMPDDDAGIRLLSEVEATEVEADTQYHWMTGKRSRFDLAQAVFTSNSDASDGIRLLSNEEAEDLKQASEGPSSSSPSEQTRFDMPGAVFTERPDRGPGARFIAQIETPGADGPPARDTDISIRWLGRAPATFALRFPVDVLPKHLPDLRRLARSLRAAADYGRAEGIRFVVQAELFADTERVTVAERFSGATTLGTAEPALPVERLVPKADLSLDDALPTFDDAKIGSTGAFGNARYDYLVLDGRGPVSGYFDESDLGYALLEGGDPSSGCFDEDAFLDFLLLTGRVRTTGRFDADAAFDDVLLAERPDRLPGRFDADARSDSAMTVDGPESDPRREDS